MGSHVPHIRPDKFKENKVFRKEYDRKRWAKRAACLELGAVPMPLLHFSFCLICGEELMNYKTTIRETCSRKCGYKLGTERRLKTFKEYAGDKWVDHG